MKNTKSIEFNKDELAEILTALDCYRSETDDEGANNELYNKIDKAYSELT